MLKDNELDNDENEEDDDNDEDVEDDEDREFSNSFADIIKVNFLSEVSLKIKKYEKFWEILKI